MIIPDSICTKKLIISLIKDDLINTRLIHCLMDIEIDAEKYTLNLSETICDLMGFTQDEKEEHIFDCYYELSRHARHYGTESDYLDILAMEIYETLDARRIEFKGRTSRDAEKK